MQHNEHNTSYNESITTFSLKRDPFSNNSTINMVLDVPNTNWSLILFTPNKQIETEVNKIMDTIILLEVCIIFILSVISLIILIQLIARPLRKITLQVKQSSESNLTPIIYTKYDNEFRILANEFNNKNKKLNTTLNNLKLAEQEIRKHSIDLEDEVRERTEELQSAISEAVEAKDSAQLANEAKSIFLANMSHELRTPLHGILSFSELGTEKTGIYDDIKIKQYFELISQSGNRLLILLNNLLDLAKLEAGHVPMDLKQQSIDRTIETTIRQSSAYADEKNHSIIYDKNHEELIADYDEDQLIQVLTNLISNAIKFSSESHPITITSEPSRLNGLDAIKVSIENTGVGIPEQELESIFDKFIQSSKTTNGAGGTGLGLAICKEIIKAHNGIIAAEKTKNNNSVFYFIIPKHPSTRG